MKKIFLAFGVGGVLVASLLFVGVSYFNKVEAHDVPGTQTAGAWRRDSNLPYPKYAHGAAVSGSSLYLIAGNNPTGAPNNQSGSVLQLSSAAAGASWTDKGVFGQLNKKWPATVGDSAGVHIFGGQCNTSGCLGQPQNTYYRYNPSLNTVSTLPAMPRTRGAPAAAKVGTKFYVFGGSDSNPNNTVTDIFNGSTWSTDVTPGPISLSAPTAVAAPNGKIYIFSSNKTYEYTPGTTAGSWVTKAAPPTTLAPRPTADYDSAAGIIRVSTRTFHYGYNYQTNQWTTYESRSVNVDEPAGAMFGGRFFVAGGSVPTFNPSNPNGQVVESYGVTSNTAHLNVVLSIPDPTASGSVISSPVGINCGTDCHHDYAVGTDVLLTATPGPGSRFVAWSGACSGAAATCLVDMNTGKTATASFEPAPECSDGIDNDGDGQIDYPSDLGCANTGDDDEGGGVQVMNNLQSNCSQWGPISATNATPGPLQPGGNPPTISQCDGSDFNKCAEPEYLVGTLVELTASPIPGCAVRWRGAPVGATGVNATDCQIDAVNPNICRANAVANLMRTVLVDFVTAGACADGIDNDGDGSIDYRTNGTGDPGCSSPTDTDEGWRVRVTVTNQTSPVPPCTSGSTNSTCNNVDNFPDGNGFPTPQIWNCMYGGNDTYCRQDYNNNTSVRLSADILAWYDVVWGGDGASCGSNLNCDFTITSNRNITATFTLIQYALTVTKTGTGSGTVTSNPVGINCGTDCSENYNRSTNVTLTATPAAGSTFTGWGGACSGSNTTCTVAMSSTRDVTANFTTQTPQYQLSVTKSGTGTGTVTSSPAGINCGTDCTESYISGTTVTLTATADPGSQFVSWSANCTPGAGNTCTTTMSAAKTVTATFNINQHTLNVTKTGTGAGTVTSSPAGINCGTDCTQDYNEGTEVTLTATATAGSTFTGWSGACSGNTQTCAVTMDLTKTATANFVDNVPLTVTKIGTGTGTVTSSPAGINCGADCTEEYAPDTQVTLTATASPGSTFTGWSNACSGTAPTCVVTISGAQTATASFNVSYLLTISKAGNGTGLVTSAPTGISCGSDCTENYVSGTTVTLTATADPGSQFVSWSANCTPGAGNTCTTTMSAAKTVTATFSSTIACSNGIDDDGDGLIDFPNDPGCSSAADPDEGYRLTITVSGTGAGAVDSNPLGIVNCTAAGGDCVEHYDSGTSVLLTAVANAGSTFGGWSGSCTGSNSTCTVVMSTLRTATAQFKAFCSDGIDNDGDGLIDFGTGATNDPGCSSSTDTDENPKLTVTVTGSGSVGSSPAGISNCTATAGDCVEHFVLNTNVTLTATPGAGQVTSWVGCTVSATNPNQCTASMGTSRNVSVTFSTALSATCTVSPSAAGLGEIVTWTANPSGGAAPYTYLWSGTPGLAGETTHTVNLGYTSYGTKTGSVQVTDSNGAQVTSAACTNTINGTNTVIKPRLTTGIIGNGQSTGAGTVTDSPNGVNCSTSTCAYLINSSASVNLVFTPEDATSLFVSWLGPSGPTNLCAQGPYTSTCSFTMLGDYLVKAQTVRTACSDGLDNDGDGVIDMADPGCGSPSDNDEADPPACSDGIDNDGDGVRDFGTASINDPGCTSPTDNDEGFRLTVSVTGSGGVSATAPANPAPNPPSITSCLVGGSASNCTEHYNSGTSVTLTATPPSGQTVTWTNCTPSGNTCVTVMSSTKTVTATFSPLPACSDGLDNDGDGLIDFGTGATNDPGCSSSTDTDENPKLTVTVTGGGSVSATAPANPAPNPPSISNCTTAASPNNCTEHYVVGTTVTLTATPPVGQSTTWTNCTISPTNPNQCTTTMATSKVVSVSFGPSLAISCTVSRSIAGVGEILTWTANPSGGSGSYTFLWAGTPGLAGETTQIVNLAYGSYGAKTGTVRVTDSNGVQVTSSSCVNPGGTTGVTVKPRLLTGIIGDGQSTGAGLVTDTPNNISCSASTCSYFIDQNGTVSLNFTPSDSTSIFISWVDVNGTSSLCDEGPYTTSCTFLLEEDQILKAQVARTACADGFDNDGDGLVDAGEDPGCSSPEDDNETDAPRPQCSDGQDNDGDGDIDYPADSGCTGPDDNNENTPPQCSDGIDNNGDGETDYPDDNGCTGPNDPTESDSPACSDGLDNDGDGYIDFGTGPGNDPSCSSPDDDDESQPPACSDGIDNDGDGFTDSAADPDCSDPDDNTENPPAQCSDDIDNDGDGDVDFPNDLGCSSPDDPSETTLPACSDGLDNDGDGLVDYGTGPNHDPSCSSPADNDEVNPPACSDGVDNDGDGLTDYGDGPENDPDCSSPNDNSEPHIEVGAVCPADGPGACPACNDGVDNDGDGVADYPGDRGCRSFNDADETDFNPDRGEF